MRSTTRSSVCLVFMLAMLSACSHSDTPGVVRSVDTGGTGGAATAGSGQATAMGFGGTAGSSVPSGGMAQGGTAMGGEAGVGGASGGNGSGGLSAGGTATASGGQGEDLRAAVAGLHGFRWEIECGSAVGDWSCADLNEGVESCPATGTRFADETVSIGAVPGQLLSVELRFRGIMEPNVYSDGVPDGDGFHVGGGGGGHRNIVAIHVSEPQQVYYLNSVPSTEGPHYALEIDYVKRLQIGAGATVQLTGADLDCITDRNCKKDVTPCEPIVVADVPPYPASFDGNFVHMDVLSVSLVE